MSMNRRAFVTSATLGAGALASCATASSSTDTALQSTLPGRTESRTYFIPAPLDVTYRAFTDPAARRVWFHPGGGVPTTAAAAQPPAPYTTHEVTDHPGLPGPTENMSRFEAVEGGTRITYVLGGYGDTPQWQNALQSSADGVDEMISDLALYLSTGVAFPRHTGAAWPARLPHPNDFRFGVRNAPGGVEVTEVSPNTLAAEAGMQPGDILVAFGDAGIYSMRDLRLANLVHAPGATIEVTWVRGGELMRGSGRMGNTPIRWRNGYTPTTPR